MDLSQFRLRMNEYCIIFRAEFLSCLHPEIWQWTQTIVQCVGFLKYYTRSFSLHRLSCPLYFSSDQILGKCGRYVCSLFPPPPHPRKETSNISGTMLFVYSLTSRFNSLINLYEIQRERYANRRHCDAAPSLIPSDQQQKRGKGWAQMWIGYNTIFNGDTTW